MKSAAAILKAGFGSLLILLLVQPRPGSSQPRPGSSQPRPGSSPPRSSPGSQKMGGGFVRFLPDQDGKVAWEMKGSMAEYLTTQLMQISNLTAISHDAEVGDLKIDVDKVVFDNRTQEARAEGERVTVRRENMVLTGKGISFLPGEKTIRVMEDIKVLIKESDQQGLFPL